MAVYKPTLCYPFLNGVDARVAKYNQIKNPAVEEKLVKYLTCKVDTSNKNITGYKVRVLSSDNQQVFPIPGSPGDGKISPITDLQELDANGNPIYEYEPGGVNSGINGTELKIPFFVNVNTEAGRVSTDAISGAEGLLLDDTAVECPVAVPAGARFGVRVTLNRATGSGDLPSTYELDRKSSFDEWVQLESDGQSQFQFGANYAFSANENIDELAITTGGGRIEGTVVVTYEISIYQPMKPSYNSIYYTSNILADRIIFNSEYSAMNPGVAQGLTPMEISENWEFPEPETEPWSASDTISCTEDGGLSTGDKSISIANSSEIDVTVRADVSSGTWSQIQVFDYNGGTLLGDGELGGTIHITSTNPLSSIFVDVSVYAELDSVEVEMSGTEVIPVEDELYYSWPGASTEEKLSNAIRLDGELIQENDIILIACDSDNPSNKCGLWIAKCVEEKNIADGSIRKTTVLRRYRDYASLIVTVLKGQTYHDTNWELSSIDNDDLRVVWPSTAPYRWVDGRGSIVVGFGLNDASYKWEVTLYQGNFAALVTTSVTTSGSSRVFSKDISLSVGDKITLQLNADVAATGTWAADMVQEEESVAYLSGNLSNQKVSKNIESGDYLLQLSDGLITSGTPNKINILISAPDNQIRLLDNYPHSIVYNDVDEEWLDMTLSTGKIMGTTSERVQIAGIFGNSTSTHETMAVAGGSFGASVSVPRGQHFTILVTPNVSTDTGAYSVSCDEFGELASGGLGENLRVNTPGPVTELRIDGVRSGSSQGVEVTITSLNWCEQEELYDEAVIPEGTEQEPLVLQNMYMGYTTSPEFPTGSQRNPYGGILVNHNRVAVKNYDSSFGHVYPLTNSLNATSASEATYCQFFKHSNNPNEVLDTDIVDFAVDEDIWFHYYGLKDKQWVDYNYDEVAWLTNVPSCLDRYIAIEDVPSMSNNRHLLDLLGDNKEGILLLLTGQAEAKQNGVYMTYGVSSGSSTKLCIKRAASYNQWSSFIGKIILPLRGANHNWQSLAQAGAYALWNPLSIYSGSSSLFFTPERPILLFQEKINPHHSFTHFYISSRLGPTNEGGSDGIKMLEGPVEPIIGETYHLTDYDYQGSTPSGNSVRIECDGVALCAGDRVVFADGFYGVILSVDQRFYDDYYTERGYYNTIKLLVQGQLEAADLFFIQSGEHLGQLVFAWNEISSKVPGLPNNLVRYANWTLHTATIMHNSPIRTFVSPWTGLQQNMKFFLLNNKKANFSDTGESSWITVEPPPSSPALKPFNDKVYFIRHRALASPLVSEPSEDGSVPWRYDIRYFFRTSDENPFYSRETPYLLITKNGEDYSNLLNSGSGLQNLNVLSEGSDDSWIPFLSLEESSSTHVQFTVVDLVAASDVRSRAVRWGAKYVQFGQGSWENYRWTLYDDERNVLQDTGVLYDKEIAVSFFGLFNNQPVGELDPYRHYFAELQVEDSYGDILQYVVAFRLAPRSQNSPAFLSDGDGNFTADLDCKMQAVKVQVKNFPNALEYPTYSIYRREYGVYQNPKPVLSGYLYNGVFYEDFEHTKVLGPLDSAHLYRDETSRVTYRYVDAERPSGDPKYYQDWMFKDTVFPIDPHSCTDQRPWKDPIVANPPVRSYDFDHGFESAGRVFNQIEARRDMFSDEATNQAWGILLLNYVPTTSPRGPAVENQVSTVYGTAYHADNLKNAVWDSEGQLESASDWDYELENVTWLDQQYRYVRIYGTTATGIEQASWLSQGAELSSEVVTWIQNSATLIGWYNQSFVPVDSARAYIGEWEPVMVHEPNPRPSVASSDSGTYQQMTNQLSVNDLSGSELTFYDFNVRNDRSYQYIIYPGEAPWAPGQTEGETPQTFANFNGKLCHLFSFYDTLQHYILPRGGVQYADSNGSPVAVHWPYWSIVELTPESLDVDAPIVKAKYKVNPEKIWLFKYSFDSGQQTQTFSKDEFQSMGQYPQFGYGATNYSSGSVSALLGQEIVPASKNRYVERLAKSRISPLSTNERAEMLKAWYDFCSSPNPKLLRDIKGQSWIVQVTSNTTTPQNFVYQQPETISFQWKQIGSTQGAIIYGECNPTIQSVVENYGAVQWKPVF